MQVSFLSEGESYPEFLDFTRHTLQRTSKLSSAVSTCSTSRVSPRCCTRQPRSWQACLNSRQWILEVVCEHRSCPPTVCISRLQSRASSREVSAAQTACGNGSALRPS